MTASRARFVRLLNANRRGFANWPCVITFLAAHSGLGQAIVERPTAVARYFAPGGRITLEVPTDPEDGAQSLLATIVTAWSPSRARSHLDQFDRPWWLVRAWHYCPLVVIVESGKSQRG